MAVFRHIFIKTKLFLFIYLVALLLGGYLLLNTNKLELHVNLNQFHTPFFDLFFRITTFLGDGLTPFIFGVVFLFISFYKSIGVAIIPSIAGLSSQFFKRVVYPNVARPKGVFGDDPAIYYVPGVDMHSMHSFPSGHTTTIFSLALCLAFFSKNKYWQIFWFFTACIVAYSRVYISQHFFVDVYFGSILGVVCAILLLVLLNKWKNSKALNNSLLTVFNKN